MSDDRNGWGEYRLLVVETLEEIKEGVNKNQEAIGGAREDIINVTHAVANIKQHHEELKRKVESIDRNAKIASSEISNIRKWSVGLWVMRNPRKGLIIGGIFLLMVIQHFAGDISIDLQKILGIFL